MIATTTLTRTGLRLELVSLEMQSLNDRSLKDRLLNDIIAYCVPLKCLEAFTIYGMDGDEAHMRLEVRLDYDEHEQQVTLSGDGLPGDIVGSYTLEDGLTTGAGLAAAQQHRCPHMGKAVDLYMRLVKDKGLRLDWTVRFRDRRDEMREKFTLGPALIRDCTVDGVQSTVTNSRYPELIAVGRVSGKIVPSD